MKVLNKPTIDFLMIFVAGSFALASLTSCTNITKPLPNVELIQDMLESPAIKPQEYDETSPNHSGMRVPPEGTQPIGFVPYRFATNIVGAVKNRNPFAGDSSDEVLRPGLKYFVTNCTICHGENGEGGEKMPVGEKMALKPPSLLSPKIKSWTDGQIYHVITVGQGLMGPYASHIPQKYRWQVVNYIRTLQKEKNK